MKKINTILNIILSVAVIVLFILVFKNNHVDQTLSTKQKKIDSVKKDKPETQLPVAYINNDSLMNNYKLVKDMKAQFNAKMNAYQNELQQKMAKLNGDIKKFQDNARYMTQDEGQKKQKALMQRQQDLAQMRDNLSQRLSDEEDTMNKMLKQKVNKLLKEHSKKEKYQLIFAYSDASDILYVDSAMDITDTIIKELNAQYEAEKAASKKNTAK